MYKDDTICAIATGLGTSAIGIIRVSGPKAITSVDGIFRGKKKISQMDSFTAAFGYIFDGNEMLDEVIVLVMRGPHTYTTEDTVEIDCHGGSLVMQKILTLLIKSGVRAAEPGEFTKRAYLGGRIDMSEAEAVMDVIQAETDRSLSASLNQLRGALSSKVNELRERILYQTAYIESALDDPENYSLDGYDEKLRQEIGEVKSEIDRLIETSDEGRIIKEGIRTVIAGRPNVGKSSMLNRLIGEERAIVTDIEGTTRDVLEEGADIGGVYLRLIDTAGIRETDNVVEKIGVDRARNSIEKADLILFLLDGTDEITEEDRIVINELSGKNVIVLINKIDKLNSTDNILDAETSDLSENLDKNISDKESPEKENPNKENLEKDNSKIENLEMENSCEPGICRDHIEELLQNAGVKRCHILYVSARTGEGIEELKKLIKELFISDGLDYNNQVYITRVRHKASLIDASGSLGRVLDSIEAAVGEDFYTIDLMAAYESLGEIIGETLGDDLADKIFSEFCMGK